MSAAYVIFCVIAAYAIAIAAAARYRGLLPWLLLGVTFRVLVLCFEVTGIWSPPNSGLDAAGFIRSALFLSTQSWADIVGVLRFGSTNNYVATGAAVFKVFGFHPYSMQATNLVVGTASVCLASRIAWKYFGRVAAVSAAILLCLYPFSAFNSVIALREEFVVFFFVCGLFFLLRWTVRGDVIPFLLANTLFLLSAAFHPGMIGAVVAATGYYLVLAIKGLKGSANRKSAVINAGVGLLMFGGAVGALAGGVELGKDMELSLDADVMADTIGAKFDRNSLGGSGYPSFVTRGDPITQPWLIPARMAYFLFSPFPWDVRSPVHIVGLFVGVLYLWLFVRGWRAFRKGTFNGRQTVLVWVFLLLTFVFAVGTTNSGTAIRHKTKFFPLLVILAAPTFRRRIVFGSAAKGMSSNADTRFVARK